MFKKINEMSQDAFNTMMMIVIAIPLIALIIWTLPGAIDGHFDFHDERVRQHLSDN